MPLFTFACSKCNELFEKFFHVLDEKEVVVCEKCGEPCERQFSVAGNRVWLDAKTLFEEKIAPDANRILNNMNSGKDSDFLDVCGEK